MLLRYNIHMDFSKNLYDFAFEYATEGVFQSTPEGRFLYVNKAMAQIFGYESADEMIRKIENIGAQIHASAESRERFIRLLDEQGTVENFEARNLQKNGGKIWTQTNARVVRDEKGKVLYYFGFVRDITLQKMAEQARDESEIRYRSLVEQLPAAVYIDAPTDNLDSGIYISPQIEKISGYTPSEWTSTRAFWPSIIHPDDRDRFILENDRTNASGAPFDLEYRIIHKNGQGIWIRDMATLTRDEANKALYWHGLILDISEQKRFQEVLQASEERFEKIFHSSPVGVSITSLEEGRFIDANEAYCLLVEYPLTELLGRTTIELGLWDFPHERSQLVQDLKKTLSLKEYAGSVRTKSGKVRNVISFYELVKIQGKPCVLSTHLDTSGQEKAQEAFRAIADSYRGLFDSVSDAVYILDQEGRFIDVNKGAIEMYGYPADFFQGKSPVDLSAPGKNDLGSVFKAIQLAFQGSQQKIEFWGMRSNGISFPKDVHLSRGKYFGQDVVFALAQDITEKKQAEQALRRREAILEAIAYASELFFKSAHWTAFLPEILERLGKAGEASRAYLFRNKRGAGGELLVDQVDEWCAPGIIPQIHNPSLSNFDYAKNNFNFLTDVLTNGQVYSALTKNLPSPIREEFEAEDILSFLNVPIMVGSDWWGFIGYDECTYERTWSQPEIEALKAAAAILGAVIERSKVADELVSSEERYRILVEQASDGIFIADQHGNYLSFNQSGCTMLGYTLQELLHLSITSMLDKQDLIKKPFRYSEIQPGETITTERILCRKDGSVFPAELSVKRLPNNTYQGFIRDIAERRKALDAQERQLKELSVLQALATAGSNARDEDELIEQATEIIGHTIYTDILGFLLVSQSGQAFRPHSSYHGINSPGWMRDYSLDEGVAGAVIRSGQPINIANVHEAELYIEINPIAHSELCVPMKIGERVIGAINAESSVIGHFTLDDERLMLTIAGQIANAIERLRNAAAERDQRVLAEALRDTAETLNSTLDFNNVLDRILENIGRVVPSETAMIMLLEGNTARTIRHRGLAQRGGKEWADSLRIDCRAFADFRHAIETREPQLISDTRLDPDWVSLAESSWIHSHLLAPILADQNVIGFIVLDHFKEGFFSEKDKERLLAFSNQAATALENARLFQSERQRRQEAETLREATAVVATTLNSSQAVSLILDQLSRVLQYDSASIQLLRQGYLEIVGGQGWMSETAILGMHFPVPGDNPNSTVVLERKPLIINAARQISDAFLQPPHDHIMSWMGIPLVARGEVIGMLAVDSREENHFTEEHLRITTAFANQAAIAIENARLYEKNEEQINRLTSLRDIDTAIASSMDLRVTLNILVDQAMAQLKPDALSILAFNPYLQTLEVVASAGFHALANRRKSRIGDGLAGTIAINRRFLQIPNINTLPEFSNIKWIAEEKFVQYIGAPLIGKGQIKGVLEAFFRSDEAPSAEWLEFLQTLAGQAAIAVDNAQLFENLQRSNQELSLAYDTTLEGWGKALELRDKETEGHTRRVADMTIRLARRMGIGESEITHIRRGVLLHDIGKMGVPDHILRKTGPLTTEEWDEMRLHPKYAYDLLHPISYLRPALDIPYCHHEKWDGSGYPRGLRGTDIPLPARVFAVVDVWDALLSDRPYRASWTREKTIEYLRHEAGTRFDPNVVRIFIDMILAEG